ncbi:phosphoesterase, partial [Xanthomonas perforans]
MMAARRSVSALLAAIATISVSASAADRAAEPNTQVPAGSAQLVGCGFLGPIVAP